MGRRPESVDSFNHVGIARFFDGASVSRMVFRMMWRRRIHNGARSRRARCLFCTWSRTFRGRMMILVGADDFMRGWWGTGSSPMDRIVSM